MLFGHYDKDRTKEYRKSGRFKSPKSKVLIRKDGSERFVLAGADKSNLREAVFERDRMCVDYGNSVDACSGPMELSHWPPMSKSGGSDEMATCFCRCRKHHRLLDGHGQDLHF